MKTCFIVGLIVLTAGLTGCLNGTRWQTVHGSGNVVTERREVSQFDRVHVSGSGELTLVQGDEESLTVETDDNLLPWIRSEVVNGRLRIGPENVTLRATKPIQYRLQLKELDELHLSGAVQAQADRIKTEHLALHISGSGSVKIGQLDAGTLAAHISGSGSTSVAGRVERQEIRISGSGSHNAPELESSEAEAHISGSGEALLQVEELLSAHISGSGRVDYRGNAEVESHTSGSGRVHHLGRN